MALCGENALEEAVDLW